jgi:hypothetical protein
MAMRIIANDEYDPDRVFQLDLSAEEFGIINFAVGQLTRHPLFELTSQTEETIALDKKLEALREEFVAKVANSFGHSDQGK